MPHIAGRKAIPEQQELRLVPVKFSLIIPSYNNAEELMRELPGLVHFFRTKQFEPEIIIVNDGSGQISSLSKYCADNGYKLISHEVNQGKGASVRTGMMNAGEKIRIFTDADIPFQYDIFEDILRKFENPEVMVVCGDRRKSDYFRRTPLVRRLGSGVFSMMVNVIMLRNMGDTQCGIKAFHSEVVHPVFDRSHLKGFAADIEWLYRASQSGIRVHWVNAEFRNAGESSVVFWKQAVMMLKDLLILRFKG